MADVGSKVARWEQGEGPGAGAAGRRTAADFPSAGATTRQFARRPATTTATTTALVF